MNRRISGRAARSAGASFESDVLATTHAIAPAIYIRRTSEPTAVVRQRGTLTRVAVGSGVADFHATVAGRSVVMECKTTGEDRWALSELAHGAKRGEPTQADGLTEATAAGATAGVLLRFATRGVVWLPWEALGPLYRRWRDGDAALGEASLTWESACEVGVEVRALRWWEAL